MSVTLKRGWGETPYNSYPIYTADMPIPENASLGSYTLKSVAVRDKAGNRTRYYRPDEARDADDVEEFDEEDYVSFTVEENVSALQVVRCLPRRQSVEAGEELNMLLEVADNAAGFQQASLTFKNPENGRKLTKYFYARNKTGEGQYEAALKISDYEPAGRYILDRMVVKDTMGNEQTYRTNYKTDDDELPLPIACSFQVAAAMSDTKPPVLNNIEIGARYPGFEYLSYQLKVKVVASQSGVKTITAEFKNDRNDRKISETITVPKDERFYKEFTGKIQIPLGEEEGTFRLNRVTLSDWSGNTATYCREEDLDKEGRKLLLPMEPTFQAQTGVTSIDDTKPWLTGVETPENKIRTGREFFISATAEDDQSGVKEVQLQFKNEAGNSIRITLTPEKGKFTGKVFTYKTHKEGVYKLSRAVVIDYADNRQTYYAQPDGYGEALPVQATFTLEDKTKWEGTR